MAGRAHVQVTRGDRVTARAILGDVGTISMGVAYAWCAREGVYHITSPMSEQERERVRNAATMRVANSRYQGRARSILRPRTDTRTRTLNGTHTWRMDTTTLRVYARTHDLARANMCAEGVGL